MNKIFKMFDIEKAQYIMMDKVENKFLKQMDAAELLGTSRLHSKNA